MKSFLSPPTGELTGCMVVIPKQCLNDSLPQSANRAWGLYNRGCVLVSDFNYHLPQELIAQEARPDRASARLLYLNRSCPQMGDLIFRDFPTLLSPDDLLVFNDTRVFPARLLGRRRGQRAQPLSPHNPASRNFLCGQVEVLLTRQLSQQPNDWECLVHPGRKIGLGEELFFGEHDELKAEVLGRGAFGERRIRFLPTTADFFQVVDRIGHVPLPPYIARADRSDDRDRYQTVYARQPGSVAAPTAGLHFTREILEQLTARQIESTAITLHVGLGTFQPVRVARVEDHRLHSECYSISPPAADKINGAIDSGRRIVAVGTTTVRTLEHAARDDRRIQAGPGETTIFIYPGFRFRVIGALLTNFHLPQSTLLMLVSAFAGRQRVLDAYEHAIRQHYRFYSYGDCMFLA